MARRRASVSSFSFGVCDGSNVAAAVLDALEVVSDLRRDDGRRVAVSLLVVLLVLPPPPGRISTGKPTRCLFSAAIRCHVM